MSENSEKNLQEMFADDVSVDDEQLNSIAEDDSLLDSNGDIVSGQRSPPRGVITKSEDTTTRTDAAASSKAEQAEPAKENSLSTNPHSKQGEEFPKEALLENVHAAPPPPIVMTSLA